MSGDQKIHYSMGTNKFDNQPLQLVSDNFNSFERKILSTRSSKKGQTFFTAGFTNGAHTNLDKYPEEAHYRLKRLALPRRFMPMDFDGFATIAAYQHLFLFLKKYRGFGYETWSHMPYAPRARAVLELSRPVMANESLQLGLMLEEEINKEIGSGLIKFDKSVYQLEQPIYVAPKNANAYVFSGNVMDVDRVLVRYLYAQPQKIKTLKRLSTYKVDDLTESLMGKMPPPDETPRQINRLKGMLGYISADCDYEVYRRMIWAILSTQWCCAEDMAYEWSVTAPDRFDQRVLEELISGFNPDLPNHPTIGSIKFLAEEGGWSE